MCASIVDTLSAEQYTGVLELSETLDSLITEYMRRPSAELLKRICSRRGEMLDDYTDKVMQQERLRHEVGR